MSTAVQTTCPCPGTPHPDGDTVYLRDKLDYFSGVAVQHLLIEANQASEALSEAKMTAKLGEAYLLYGVESWTLVDEQGRAVPVTEETIRSRLLSDFSVAAPVGDMADALYMTAVILPLVRKAGLSSLTTPTDASTSPRQGGTRKPRKPSKRSSTTTTPMDGTAKTSRSPGGAFSS